MRAAVAAYLVDVDPATQPAGIERTVSFVSGDLRMSGRVDRLDDRDGELVVVDYKTSRVPSTDDDARTSLALGLYAAAVWKMFRRRTLRVELHHVPSGTVAVHEHTPESLTRKVEQARSIARDARRADADFAEKGAASELFAPRPGPLCGWCDLRAHCPEGQAAGPEKSDWAALEEPARRAAGVGRAHRRLTPRGRPSSPAFWHAGGDGPAHLVRDPAVRDLDRSSVVLRRRVWLGCPSSTYPARCHVPAGRAARALAVGPGRRSRPSWAHRWCRAERASCR